jgi:hypothetical protein
MAEIWQKNSFQLEYYGMEYMVMASLTGENIAIQKFSF